MVIETYLGPCEMPSSRQANVIWGQKIRIYNKQFGFFSVRKETAMCACIADLINA